MSDMASDDLGTALRAQRDHLVACLAECPVDKVAPLHARLTDVLVRLSAMEAPEESTVDELAAAREDRLKKRTGS